MSIDPRLEHETATIKSFVVRTKQERLLSFLGNPKTRQKFTRELPHFGWFDRRFASQVPWKVDASAGLWERHNQGTTNISRLLRSKGAGRRCWVISEDQKIDGQELDLDDALGEVLGRGMGTILSCVPGRLALFEGEDESLLLVK